MRSLTVDGPVFLRYERRDLRFPLADHAQRGALHAPGGEAAPDFLPKQRREIEPDQVIERAPCLLRIHQVERQVARLSHRRADGITGDLIEGHAMNALAAELAARMQDLLQMPGDGLPLAVRVRGQIKRFGLAQAACDRLDMTLVLLEHLVLHAEAVVGVDSALLGTRSRTCPYEASTSKSLPRYFFRVFALAGDSTMRRLSAMSC